MSAAETIARALLWCVACYGWALVLTRGAGPWGVLGKLRDAWEGGPLRCPMCIGTWLGFGAAIIEGAAHRWPALAFPGLVLASGGAGAGLAWAGVHWAERARREAERAESEAWEAQVRAHAVERQEERAEEAAKAATLRQDANDELLRSFADMAGRVIANLTEPSPKPATDPGPVKPS